MNSRMAVVGLGLSLCAIVAATGCNDTPRGSTGGRIDPYRTTAADEASYSASMPALLEFSDQATAKFASHMANLPEIRQAPTRKVLYIGSLENLTRTPTNNFAMIQQRVRDTLVSSPHIRDAFVIAEDPNKQDVEKARLTGVGDPAQDTRAKRYDAKDIYTINGTFYESGRDNVRRYYFVFNLVHLDSGELVLNERMDLGQQ